MTTSEQLDRIKKENEFLDIKVMNGKVYALNRFIYTTGLLVGVNEHTYEHRYCYPNHADAREAFATWDGVGLAPGNWIKRKGSDGEMANPDYAKDG